MQTCPRCGEENSDRARFCQACAAPLAPAPASPASERKVVSVLFVDLVGFTARSDRADPEDVQARLRPYHARLKQEVERFGGTVEKFVGDAVMAVFGAPLAHEDDAERAVRAALRVTGAIEELNEAHPGLDLSVRAAVNTGEAVVTLGARPEAGEGIVAGDVVNTASRLQQAAPVGSVVVGEVTRRATGEVIEYQELEPVRVKGKAEPVPLWRAVAARSRYGVDVDQEPRTGFIGREGDLRLLQETFGRTRRESSVQLVTIVGEPGVGKSRLAREFFAWVDDQPELVYWRQGRCLPYGEGITFWALGEIVKAQAGILESDGPEEASAKLARAVEAVVEPGPDREWVTARLGALVGTAGDGAASADREESFTAWRTFLEAVAASRPLVVVIEDLHWADKAMLAFLEHLVDWSSGVPLMLVCLARPELFERHQEWGGGKRNSATISLSPLSTDDTARLIAELLEQAVLPADTQAALLERAGGNPLYAEEFTRMLIDRGILVRRGHSWELETDGEVPLPETLQAIIAARLDTLPPARKSLLQDGAVMGKVFWSGSVAAMGGLQEAPVREGLHELARKELVRPARRSSVENQAEYSFWHVLVQEVAYGQIPRSLRSEKHQAAARWIEGLAGDRVADHAEVLAYHYGEALALARATGSTEGIAELEERAAKFLVLAGDRAGNLDLVKAESFYHRAIQLMAADHPDRPQVLIRAAWATWMAGSPQDPVPDLEEALRLSEARGDILRQGEALTRLSRIIWTRGDNDRQRALLDEALRLLEAEPPSRELVQAYSTNAGSCMVGGKAEACLAASERALTLAQAIGPVEEVARVLQFRGTARSWLGEIDEGLADIRESLRLGLELGLQETTRAYVNLAGLVSEQEGPAAGLKVYREGIEFGGRRGELGLSAWAKGETVWPLFDLGEWDELLRVSGEVIEGSREALIAALVSPYRAMVLVRRGQIDEGAELIAEFAPVARKATDPQVLVPSLVASALMANARGQRRAALDAALEALSLVDRPGHRWWLSPEIVEVLLSAGDVERARDVLRWPEEGTTRARLARLFVQAMVTEAEGRLDQSMALYREATEKWKEFGVVLAAGQALLGAGRALVGLGRPAEAEGELREAREVFARLRAAPLLAETDDWLERATALTS